jgi:hypothetical protein
MTDGGHALSRLGGHGGIHPGRTWLGGDGDPEEAGSLSVGARSIDDYQRLVEPFPGILDRPEARAPSLRLIAVLQALDHAAVGPPRPRTWCLELDDQPPDMRFPIFVRTGTRMERIDRRPDELARSKSFV